MGKFKNTPQARAGRLARVAAQRIEERGWTTGTHQDEHGALCVRAAFAVAYSDNANLWSDEFGPVGTACEVFTNWLISEAGVIIKPLDRRLFMTADAWNDGNVHTVNQVVSPWWFTDDTVHLAGESVWKFPVPREAHEVVAILHKFADEMDPQR